MKITQLSVFLENKKGRLSDVTHLLGGNSINLRALTIAESEDFGVLRMVVDKPDKAIALLKENSFVATMTEIVAVEVEDKPNGLASILQVLSDNGVNVEYMYGFTEKRTDKALMVFRFEDTDKAIEVLKANRIGIVGKQNIETL